MFALRVLSNSDAAYIILLLVFHREIKFEGLTELLQLQFLRFFHNEYITTVLATVLFSRYAAHKKKHIKITQETLGISRLNYTSSISIDVL